MFTINVSGLSKNFNQLQAVNQVSFTAKKGEIIALLGPNGAGKSTLMNMICGYLAPTSGEIEILGKKIHDYPLFAKENIGFLPEGSPLYPDLSVKNFLHYMAELRNIKKQELKNRILQVAKDAQIEEILEQKIENLSKGYQRRVGFAQSILSDPPLLLLDEPTDGLDPNQKEHIRRLISQMSTNKTILISTHLLEEAENIATRIILMNKGEIKADGTLKQILKTNSCSTLAELFRKLTRETNA